MMMKFFALWLAMGTLLGCSTVPRLDEVTDPKVELPDLRIKKIEYRQQHRQQISRRSVYEPNVAALVYEFTVLIENVGNKEFNEPFYVSVSGSLTDYHDLQFSRHIRLNDERLTIQPGAARPFTMPVVLDFPPAFSKINQYPVRVYINTEGPANSTGFPTLFVAERSYKNNTYELQLRMR